MNKKVTVIGAGYVGSTIAQLLVTFGLSDVILIDIKKGLAEGKALDLSQSLAIEEKDSKIFGSEDFSYMNDSDIVIITAGVSRTPGTDRVDMISINLKIIEDVSLKIKEFAPNSIVIVVSNPLDIMVYNVFKKTGFDKSKVIGMAGVLDSARFKYFISKKINCNVSEIEGIVLGAHSNTMVPMISSAKVLGKPLTEVLSKDEIVEVVEKTKNGGIEIVNLLETGSAFFAPARGVIEIVKSILNDEKNILPCAAYCSGEYGVNDLFIGVPVVLGSLGVEKIIELDLNEIEKEQFEFSVNEIEKLNNN